MSSKTKTTATQEEAMPARVPKLRFPGFRGAWELKTLETLGYFTGGGTPSKDNTAYWTGEIPWISSSDLTEDSISKINVNRYITKQAVQESATKLVPAKSILLISRVGVGKLAVSTFPLCTSQDFTNFTPSVADPFFLAYLLKSQKQTLLSFNQGTSIKGFTKDNIASLRLGFPAISEQQKIAECLSSVDELIAAQARKVDTLKTHKKGLMQQLFPTEGETQPRLRFPEFQKAGEWIQKTFGDVAEVLMCKRIFAEETNPNEGVPFYKIGTLGGKPDAFISREKFEDYKSRYNYPRNGEVLITCSGTVGKCLPFDGKDAYFQDSNIVWLDNSTGEISNEFLLMLLSNVNWGSLNSTTITRIYGPDLRGMAINYPADEAEQHRIASCLSSLDALITLETQKLEALKTHKKGLMQQLFPSPDELEA
ncbi:restriction endonuclease subunit S [Acidithiobacillus concretivorus]|uniref:Restriction endonuclease subunit S n=1 Tax=Acidithiobacillus concretivorus TaxID=3063952 RepID=A0ABS5ZKV7_9PROT|nr:restriction endonuclease subunit S [Acidithiobacillus concretivorus]MBU2737335.1 restriction endonuclease subunit S [Acidithiobacillus concretivorus]